MDKWTYLKTAGTHADVLAAVGAAELLRTRKPQLVDDGLHFSVHLDKSIAIEDIAGTGPGFQYLKVDAAPAEDEDSDEEEQKPSKKRKTVAIPEAISPAHIFDFSLQNLKFKRQQEIKRNKTSDKTLQEAVQEDGPHPAFRSYRILKQLQAAAGTNKFVETYFSLEPSERDTAIWEALQGKKQFFFQAPLVQLFNPQSAKGYSLIKPGGTDRNDKTKEKWADPFAEWLRYRGFFKAAAGWFLGNKGEHIRLYVPIPRDIPLGSYEKVVDDLKAAPLGGSAPKMDCRAVLALTKILIDHAAATRRPDRLISGVWITHYQSLGQVKAVTAIERLGIPDWFDNRSKEDSKRWIEALDEHDKVIRRLEDSISEELGLLQQYRRFLQQEDRSGVIEFVKFLADYGRHIVRQRAQSKWRLPQFKQEGVEAILSSNYGAILEDPGFRAVANALRSATVNAQLDKRNGREYREIRYGILPELRRKIASGRTDFVGAVSDFIADFNGESARRTEMGKKGAWRVSQDEFAAFAGLMEREDWETIGALLGAMATCKLGKEKDESEGEEEEKGTEQ